ncbi:unnamed protein product [Gongylonema pulchrum]|uniref:Large ribosomal subunit protein mL44 n=1 Tax=Gongylonema pulchrum TaxID=637853 RepID=A0A183E0D1_9BILA|nr:unnamed protein product [Gongylonema pulchrum]
MLAGADPLISRSAYPNWNYDAEIYAFGHRIGAPETDKELLVRALTDNSFYRRADIADESTNAQPSRQDSYSSLADNEQLAEHGKVVSSYPLQHTSAAALIRNVVVVQLADLDMEEVFPLAEPLRVLQCFMSANGCDEVEPRLLHSAGEISAEPIFIAGIYANKKLIGKASVGAAALIRNVVVVQLADLDMEEVFPLAEPLRVLQCFMSANGGDEVEPRLLHSAGEISAEPIFIAGIYANKKLIGKGPGETKRIAADMAAMDALMRIWGVTADKKFPFGELESLDNQIDPFLKPHYSLQEICKPSLVLKFVDLDEQEPPLDVKEVALRYQKEVEAVIGKPLRRRLRHKFSRGTWGKRSFRYINKPKVYNIC